MPRQFESRMSGLRPNSNGFDAITHPKDQMKAILAEARSFFVKQLPSVTENRFDMTIL